MDKAQWQNAVDAARIVLILIAIMWAIEIIDIFLLSSSFNSLGIYPRSLNGLPGIIFWPFLHANFVHLAGNTMPLLIMGWFVALRGTGHFLKIAVFTSILSGAMVWLLALNVGFHIGASGLVFGLFGYLVARGIFEKSTSSILISLFILFYYGTTMFFGLLPIFPGVSWEGHLAGIISGGIAAKVFSSPMPELSRS